MYQKHDVTRGVTLGVVVATLAGLLVATPAMAAEKAAVPTTPVAWTACPADVADPLKQLQCAQIPVPLDYDDPNGPTIDIMISRLASANPAERRGVMLLNPGGPGDTGLVLSLSLVKEGLPATVTDGYDLIGMDTRGIGHSAPVSCGFTLEGNYHSNIPPFATDSAAVTKTAAIAKEVAAQCAANDVDGRMRHMSTANMARDLDQIRIALGEKKISYFGVSYGTALGAAYASMFPKNSDRFVLDSNIGDTHLDREGLRRYGLGVEETFPDFAKWAATRNGSYGLGRTPEEVRKTYFSLAEKLDKHPIGTLDGAAFRQAMVINLFGERLYTKTAQFWQGALNYTEPAKTDTPVTPVAPVPTAPVAPAVSTPHPADNNWSVFLAVTCNDVKFTDNIGVYKRAVAEDRKKYPVYGAASANISPCAYWAYEPSEPPVKIVDDGPENILIVQNERDPVTPHAGGVMLREKFEKRSKLVSVDGGGHGAYMFGDSACADNVTTTYLVTGKMPAKDLTC